ncbi:MAG: L28 family ribosomal protein [Candidatus Omnitrophota bacterium]|nr:L28 family ribosomal protein [Candidatus Omnitrophota bacterium]
MFKKCAICQKGALSGKIITRKGQYKAKGGTGSKIARWSMRKFLPNLQKMRVLIDGHPKKAYVCTKCLKKGTVQKV